MGRQLVNNIAHVAASVVATLIFTAGQMPSCAGGEGACRCGDPVGAVAGTSAESCYCGNLVNAAGGCASGDELLWFRADYMIWQRDGVSLPPLVTSSPAGTPANQQAILGQPNTSILSGNDEVSDDWRSGYRLEFGYWLNPFSGLAITGDYFDGGRDSYGFLVGPNDGRIIGRPFFDAQSNVQSARILDLPGELSGGVGVSVFDDFQGAGALVQKCIWSAGNACTDEGGARLTLLGGYRYYHQDSLVYIREDYIAQAGNSFGLPAGEVHLAADKFAGRNEFHGLELGLQGRVQHCRWWCDGLAAIAMGGSRRVMFVEGTTINVDPGFAPVVAHGALLTSPASNIGRTTDDQAQAIPRFRVGAGWQITDRLSAHAGFNVIIWNGIVQAADHLPPRLEADPRNLQIPPAAGGGPEPAFPGLRDTTMVAQGLDLGLDLWF